MPPKSRPKRNAGRPRRYAVNNDSQNKIATESASASDLNTSNDEAGPSQPVSSLEARIKHLESVIEQAPIAHEPRQSRSRSKDKNKKRRRTASSSSTSSISSSSSSSCSTDSDRGRSKKRNTTKSRKRHRLSRKSRRSSDRRSSSTDSEYTSDSDDNIPLVTFGSKLGKNISSKIKKRIIQHKYINLASPPPTNYPWLKENCNFWRMVWSLGNLYGYLLHPSLTPERGPGATDICPRHSAHGSSELRLATVRRNLPSWPWNNQVLLGWS